MSMVSQPAESTSADPRLQQAWSIIAQWAQDPASGYFSPQDVQAALALIKQVSPSNKKTAMNLGDGRIAVFDPSTGQVDVQSAGGAYGPRASEAKDVASVQETQAHTGLVQAQTAAQKTPEQVANESAANVARDQAATQLAQAQAANVQTPEERLAAIRQRAFDAVDAAFAQKQKLIDSGIELTEKDQKELDNALKLIQINATAEAQNANAEATFQREKPFKEATQQREQQQTDILGQQQQETGRHNLAAEESQRVQNEQQQARDQQAQREAAAKPLVDQSNLLQNQVFTAAQKGTAPTAGLADLVFSPLNMAFQLLSQGVQSGQVQPSQVPTPQAPVPAGQQQQALSAPVPGGA